MSEQPSEPRLTDGEFGFAWGPVGVVRRTALPDGRVVLGLTTDAGIEIDVYVSPTGRSVRVVAKDKRVRFESTPTWGGGPLG